MPELPEVETCVRGLTPHTSGRKIITMKVRQPQLRWRIDKTLPKRLAGQTIHRISRRAKYLLFKLDEGTLILHLGMSGVLSVQPTGTKLKTHDHFDIHLDSDKLLRYNDPRRFGCCLYTSENIEQHRLIKSLGPEPLGPSFTPTYLHLACKASKSPIKSLLMNNRIVVGIGNIYANEALFHAKVAPTLPANQLKSDECHALHQACQRVLHAAIQQGGTTLKDFLNAEGKPGYFQQTLQVYGRQHQPCQGCGKPLTLLKISGRASVYCENCQRSS